MIMEVTLPRKTENHEALHALFKRLCSDFGQSSGEAIIKTIIQEIGGMRLNIPDFNDFHRTERDQRIRQLFNGRNYKELGIMFGLSCHRVRMILREKD